MIVACIQFCLCVQGYVLLTALHSHRIAGTLNLPYVFKKPQKILPNVNEIHTIVRHEKKIIYHL